MLKKIYTKLNTIFKLSFNDSNTENKFQQHYLEDNIPRNRFVVLIAVFAYIIYLPIAKIVTPSDFNVVFNMTLFLVLPSAIIFLWITTKTFFQNHILTYLFLIIIFMGIGPVISLYYTVDHHQIIYTLFILPIIAIFTMFRAPFVISILGVSILIIAFTGTTFFVNLEYNHALFAAYLIISVLFFSIISSYMVEKNKRKAYYSELIQDDLNNRLLQVQKISGIGFWEFDIKQNKLYWSDEVYIIFGLKAQEFEATYETFLNYIHPDDREKFNKEYQRSIDENQTYSVTHRIIQKNEDLKYVEEHCQHTYTEDGEHIKSTGTIYDISNRIADQNKLQKLFDLQENILVQSDGNSIINANQSFLDFFGFTSLNEYLQNHNCICKRFIENDKFFHLGKVPDGKTWIDILKELPKKEQLVTMANKNMETHAFRVSLNNFDNENYIISFTDISETMTEQFSLEKRLKYDNLTNAYSRDYFDNNISYITEKAKKDNQYLGVVMFDIDHFKNVNDTYGHDVGDEVLKHLVSTVKENIRKEDIMIRWGGEEFLLIMKTDSIDTLARITEHIRKSIEDEIFMQVSHISCSFGITLHNDNAEIHKTIKRADIALYESKNSGRNIVTIAKQDIN